MQENYELVQRGFRILLQRTGGDKSLQAYCAGISGYLRGGRFSCYIGPNLAMVPCSFDQRKEYMVSLRNMTIAEAWESESFELFRSHLRMSCYGCDRREVCMGGCPLMPEIVLCNRGGSKAKKDLASNEP